MTNKRTLKKHIKQICGAAAVQVVSELPIELARKIVIDLARLQSATVNRVTFSFDRVKKDFENQRDYHSAHRNYTKQAYNTLIKDFNESLKGIVNEINMSLSQSDKNSNKAKVNP